MTRNEAQRMVARVLERLEVETGQIVRGISVRSYDTTTIESQTTEVTRYVSIELEPVVGKNWTT